MFILYNEEGEECKFIHPIDVRQALESGKYFSENPKESKEESKKDVEEPVKSEEKKKKEEKEKKEAKKQVEQMKNKIDSGKKNKKLTEDFQKIKEGHKASILETDNDV